MYNNNMLSNVNIHLQYVYVLKNTFGATTYTCIDYCNRQTQAYVVILQCSLTLTSLLQDHGMRR